MTRLLKIILPLIPLLAAAPATAQMTFEGGLDDAEAAEVASEAEAATAAAPLDRVFTEGDRVKAVQKKLILKKWRLELAPSFSMSINDPFFQKLGGGVSGTFWLSDNLALFADIYSLSTFETSAIKVAKQRFVSTLVDSRLSFLATSGFQWTPIYGKIAWLGDEIIHFDMFFSAGFGLARSSTGDHLTTTFGVGQRFLVARWLALFYKIEDRLYPEVYALRGGPVSSISNVLTLSVGASIYFPFDFKYSE